MRKAFKIFSIFLIYSIIGVAVGTFSYSLYENVLNYVAGGKIVLFDVEIIKNAFFYVSACLVFYITSVVAYSRIRYKGGVIQLFGFIIVSVISWLVLFPLIINYGKTALVNTVSQQTYLTKGYFRKSGDNVYYHMDSLDNKKQIDVVKIDTTQDGKVTVIKISDEAVLPIVAAASPYHDILISNTFESKQKKNGGYGYINYRLLLKKAIESWEKGMSFWAGYLSLAFLLCTIYGLSNIFNWKLLNACTVMLTTLGCLAFNTQYYAGVLKTLTGLGIWRLGAVEALGKIVNDPILVIINVLNGIVFIIVGIVRFFISRKKLKKGEADE